MFELMIVRKDAISVGHSMVGENECQIGKAAAERKVKQQHNFTSVEQVERVKRQRAVAARAALILLVVSIALTSAQLLIRALSIPVIDILSIELIILH